MAWNIPSLKNQKMNIGFEILASILCVGRNSRLVKVLKEESNLVESIYVDVNGGEFGSLLVIETCCDEINLKNVEEEINFKNIELSRIFMAWSIPSLKNQKMNIGFEILASILCVGRNSRLVKVLKEERNLVESICVDVNGGEFGSLLVIEACCDEINLKNVEEEINETIQEVISCKNLTLNEIRKATVSYTHLTLPTKA